MNTDRDLEIMKLAVDSEVRRAGAVNDIYDQQRAIHNAINYAGFTGSDCGRNWDTQEDQDYLLDLERDAQEALGYDV